MWPLNVNLVNTKTKRFILVRNTTGNNILVGGEYFYNSDFGKALSVVKRGICLKHIVPNQLQTDTAVNRDKLNDIKNLLKKHYRELWDQMFVFL